MDGHRIQALRAIATKADHGPWSADEVRNYQGQPDLVGALIVNDAVAIAEIRGAVKIDGKVCEANQRNADYLLAFSPDQVLHLIDEVTYWRQDAAARLRTAMTLARAAEDRGEQARAADIRVGILYPTRAALGNALSGDIYYPLCEGCSKPLQTGDAVYAVSDDGDDGATGEIHIDCADPQRADLPPEAYRYAESEDYGPDAIAATLAKATAFLDEEGRAMAKPFKAGDVAAELAAREKLPIMVATAIADGEDGVFIQVGYGGMALEDAEHVASSILRNIHAQMVENFHDCDACRLRLSRVKDALAALERDGAKPTGQTRGLEH